VRRFFLGIFGLLFIANFICWFALDSILTRLVAPDIFHWALDGFLILQIIGMLAMMGARLVGRQPGTGLGRPLLALLLIWNLLLALPTAAMGLLWLIAWSLATSASTGHELASPSRVAGLVAAATPFAVALLATAVALWQLNHFRVKRLTLQIPRLPAALRGLTIVHLSDLHIGKLTRGKVLDDIVATTNRLDADLVLLTGDLINFSLEDLPKGFAMLSGMKSRHGLFLCEGNHDLIESRSQFEAAAMASGFRFLLHDTATVSVKGQAVQILGLRWDDATWQQGRIAGSTPYETIRDLLARRAPDAFAILLAHHPDAFDAAAEAGIPLTLAGHTHGGQLMLTPSIGFGPRLYRYWSGLYHKGASQLVVSNGAGNWFPLRLGAPAEIIHLTLEPAP
jgi:predicted MPP superfamily phosphohydrolase